MPGLHKVLNMSEKFLHILDYTWICRNVPCYAGILVNMPKSACVDFVSHDLILIPCLLEHMVIYFSKIYSLKEHETVFLKRQNLIFFFVVAGCIWYIFCLRLNIFTRFQIWFYPWWLMELDCESCYTKFQYSIDIWSTLFCVLNGFDLKLKILNIDWYQDYLSGYLN